MTEDINPRSFQGVWNRLLDTTQPWSPAFHDAQALVATEQKDGFTLHFQAFMDHLWQLYSLAGREGNETQLAAIFHGALVPGLLREWQATRDAGMVAAVTARHHDQPRDFHGLPAATTKAARGESWVAARKRLRARNPIANVTQAQIEREMANPSSSPDPLPPEPEVERPSRVHDLPGAPEAKASDPYGGFRAGSSEPTAMGDARLDQGERVADLGRDHGQHEGEAATQLEGWQGEGGAPRKGPIVEDANAESKAISLEATPAPGARSPVASSEAPRRGGAPPEQSNILPTLTPFEASLENPLLSPAKEALPPPALDDEEEV